MRFPWIPDPTPSFPPSSRSIIRSISGPARGARAPKGLLAVAVALTLAGSACAGGARPVLIQTNTSVQDVAASLPPAPPEVALVGPASAESPGQPELEDALFEWANAAGLNYVGDCIGREVAPGELCGRGEGVGDLYLVGPDTLTAWYVVSVGFTIEGYRVDEVMLAGTQG